MIKNLEEERKNVGKGWQGILDALDQAIDDLGITITAEQIKEKFGTLRFYFTSNSAWYKEISLLVNEAERRSSITCEDCGNPGELIGGGYSGMWLRTLCALCKAANDRDRDKNKR